MMGPLHHPDEATLISYASGALSQVISLVTAAHLERCAECRMRLRQAEQIGGVLMQQHTSTVVPLKGRSAMLARLGEQATSVEPPMHSMPAANQDPDLLPTCMQAHFGRHLSELKWKTLVPGVQRVRAEGIEHGNLMLLKIAPGVSMPVHSHESGEMTMVLKGLTTTCRVNSARVTWPISTATSSTSRLPTPTGNAFACWPRNRSCAFMGCWRG